MENRKIVYADNAATTKISESVFIKMKEFICENYGNPSSVHALGRKARAAVDNARRAVAGIIGSEKEEVYFTSGGTESNNWVLKGINKLFKRTGKNHIITTAIEHPSIINAEKEMEKDERKVTYLNKLKNGIIEIHEVKKSKKD